LQLKAFGKTGRPGAAALADPAAAAVADASLAAELKSVKKRRKKKHENKKGQAAGKVPIRKYMKFPEKPAWHKPRRFLSAPSQNIFASSSLT